MVLTMTELNQHKLRQLNDWILTCPLCPNHDKKVCQVSQHGEEIVTLFSQMETLRRHNLEQIDTVSLGFCGTKS